MSQRRLVALGSLSLSLSLWFVSGCTINVPGLDKFIEQAGKETAEPSPSPETSPAPEQSPSLEPSASPSHLPSPSPSPTPSEVTIPSPTPSLSPTPTPLPLYVATRKISISLDRQTLLSQPIDPFTGKATDSHGLVFYLGSEGVMNVRIGAGVDGYGAGYVLDFDFFSLPRGTAVNAPSSGYQKASIIREGRDYVFRYPYKSSSIYGVIRPYNYSASISDYPRLIYTFLQYDCYLRTDGGIRLESPN